MFKPILNLFLSFVIILTLTNELRAQQPAIKNFVVWAGSASATNYNSSQGVFFSPSVKITGNVGSNHQVQGQTGVSITGNVISSNQINLANQSIIRGNLFSAKRAANYTGNAISAGSGTKITGNITANGKVDIKLGSGGLVTGVVRVPSPYSTNYSGPPPQGGYANMVEMATLLAMPSSMPFDNQAGTTNISSSRDITPGAYRTLALPGNSTVKFSGPGTYIFYDVNNLENNNELVFDFKNTKSGNINIYVVNDANWGKLAVRMVNGNAPARIYTEVHGNGSTNSGNAFAVSDVSARTTVKGIYNWLGTVWAPNGGITIGSTTSSSLNFINVAGALWSGTKVSVATGITINYQAPIIEQVAISPYFPPPTNGKVDVTNNVIGAELYSLSQNTAPISSIPNNQIFRIVGNKILIDVISRNPDDATLRSQLEIAGMTGFINNGPDRYVITGYFPIASIPTLKNIAGIVYVRPSYPPFSNAGQVTTQGDNTMRTNFVRSRFGLDGQGVKIGVLSDSYNAKGGAQHDVDEGDLPGVKLNGQPNENSEPVQIIQDLLNGQTVKDEGRAILQILSDVAPNAKLAFSTGFLTAGHFANAISTLASPDLPGGRCDILVDDITYITEPFLRDGIVARTVNEAVSQGVTYFTSAGNFGERSYEENFRPVPLASTPIAPSAAIPPTATVHRFGADEAAIYQTVLLKPGTYTVVMQWSDNFYSLSGTQGVVADLDLYLLSSTGSTLFGFNRSNVFGDPFEVCPFTVDKETLAKVMVINATGTTGNIRFKYIIFGADGTIVDYQNSQPSTIVGHANADGAIAVGAMLYANIPQYTPIYPSIASFSSRGGTGTLTPANTFVPRMKPNLVAPNGVNTTVPLGGPAFDDGDVFPNFFGTSAAAPHAAAAGALLLQAKKKYGLQLTVTPDEIKTGLESTSGRFVDQTTAHTFTGGYGYVQADSAVQQIANPRPIINKWEAVVPGTSPGTSPFQVRVKGAYLTENTVVYFNNLPLETTVSPTKTEATATVPAIARGEDPPLQLFNAAKSPSGLDGGFSEAIHFFSAKVPVIVKAQNKTRKFGQENASFASDVLVNGVPIGRTNVTLADLKLDGNNLVYLTNATAESNVGLYSINPARSTQLEHADPLLATYDFTFVPGTLTIEKMPLKITPQSQTVRYGDYLNEVEFNYQFDGSLRVDATQLNRVKALHKRYLASNAIAVMNGFGDATTGVTAADLTNVSLVSSFQSIKNSRVFQLSNGQLQPVVNALTPGDIVSQRYFVDVPAQALANAKVNPSQSVMVPSTAGGHARALLSIKALANGTAKAAIPNGQLQPVVNGQLLAMVNGQLQAVVNGQLQAVVNGTTVLANDIIFQNGQLQALVNGQWLIATNGQLQAVVNGVSVTVDLSVLNGQLQAVVNGVPMTLVNGQLQAVVNGQLLAVVNGQLQAVVNGQLMPVVNGQLMAMVNGQLQPVVNGQLLAVVNGQLMAVVNGQLELVESLSFTNGQLRGVVNGQLLPIVNGQLRAMVNGVITEVSNPTMQEGQLQVMVNGQLQAVVNGQIRAVVNGTEQSLISGDVVPVSGVRQLSNGQLRAVVNATDIPLRNGQLQAVVNGQLLAVVNGQLLAVVNGELTFAVFQNGQLQAVVNGQLQPVVNSQLRAVVNNLITPVDSYSIVNGQLQAVVNGQSMVFANNQLLSFANGQLQPVVNNFDVSGINNNANTLVVVDQDDINVQGGAIGGMFAMNMITGLNVGKQKLCPGAFLDNNFEVTYGVGDVDVVPRPLVIKADDVTKIYGQLNPPLTMTAIGFAYNDNLGNIIPPGISVAADKSSYPGQYPVVLSGSRAINYSLVLENGTLLIKKAPLIVKADDKMKLAGDRNPPLTITYNGLVNGNTEEDICAPKPPLPRIIRQLERTATYTNVKLNGGTNKLTVAPGTLVTYTADYSSLLDDNPYCPGCVTQNYTGIKGVFTECHDVSFEGLKAGSISQQFIAPAKPGVYYITQLASWEYKCYDGGTGVNFNNNFNDAIAVLVVETNDEQYHISVTTTADVNSLAGTYPITVNGCVTAPFYEVTYQSGTLSVTKSVATSSTTHSATAERQELTKKQYLAPNPANDLIRVEAGEGVAKENSIIVVDELGRRQQVKGFKKISDSQFEINVSSLPKGVYLLRVTTNGNAKTFKFMKL